MILSGTIGTGLHQVEYFGLGTVMELVSGSSGLEPTLESPWANVLILHAGQPRLELHTGKKLELNNE